jgi:hypothetical protein
MDTKNAKIQTEQARIVYIRSVNAEELPDEVREKMDGLKEVYVVHSADGERLAVVKERNLAYALARQNDLSPVTIH